MITFRDRLCELRRLRVNRVTPEPCRTAHSTPPEASARRGRTLGSWRARCGRLRGCLPVPLLGVTRRANCAICDIAKKVAGGIGATPLPRSMALGYTVYCTDERTVDT